MCFDGKTGGFALLKWDLLGIEMTRQHFRLFSSLELDSHKIWFRQNWVRFVLCQKIINMAHWSIFAFSFGKLHLCKPFWWIYSYILILHGWFLLLVFLFGSDQRLLTDGSYSSPSPSTLPILLAKTVYRLFSMLCLSATFEDPLKRNSLIALLLLLGWYIFVEKKNKEKNDKILV